MKNLIPKEFDYDSVDANDLLNKITADPRFGNVYVRVCDGSDEGNEPFLIFEDWESIGRMNMIANDILLGEQEHWQIAKEYYTMAAAIHERYGTWRDKGPMGYGDMDYVPVSQLVPVDTSRLLIDPTGSKMAEFIAMRKAEEAIEELWGIERDIHLDGLVTVADIFAWGFSDEYEPCSGCNRAVRTSEDSYRWVPDFHRFEDGELVCGECLPQFADEYFEEHLNNPDKACTAMAPGRFGFEEVDIEFKNGLHHGMNADPKRVSAILSEHEIDHLFDLSTSQFYVTFWAYVRPEDLEQATMLLRYGKTDLPYDKATELGKALRGGPSSVYTMETVTFTDGEAECPNCGRKILFVDGVKCDACGWNK